MTSPATIRLLEAEVGELVASHAVAEGVVDFARYRDNPNGFAEDVLRVSTLWVAQREHLNAVAHHRRVVAYGANGTGKTLDDAILALWWIYCWDGLVVATSAKELQLQSSFMRDVARLFHQAPALPGELYSMALRRPERPEAGLLCSAAGVADNLRSYHAPRVMIQLQEAQGLPDFAFSSAEMMAVGEADRVTVSGNSSQPGGELHRRVKSSAWVSVRFDATQHPNVTTGTVVIPGGPTRESLAQRATDYGTDSGFYLASVTGVFPADSPESLVRREWLDAAAARWESGALEEAAAGQSWTAALDVARYGADKSCLCLREGPIVRRLVTWGMKDTMTTTGLVLTTLREWNRPLWKPQPIAAPGAPPFRRDEFARPASHCTTRLLVDEIGLGSAVVDRLREQGFEVEGFNGSRSPRAPAGQELYANMRAEAFWGLRRLLEAGALALPRDDKLFEELTTTTWRPNSAGRIIIESKDDLRARLGRSPDLADSVSMCTLDLGAPRGVAFAPVRVRMG